MKTKHQKQKESRRKQMIANVAAATNTEPHKVTDKEIGSYFGYKAHGKFGANDLLKAKKAKERADAEEAKRRKGGEE